jgi:hypothetical protein
MGCRARRVVVEHLFMRSLVVLSGYAGSLSRKGDGFVVRGGRLG